jgi:hypothetical protein
MYADAHASSPARGRVHADEDATIKRAMRLVMNGSSMGAFQRAAAFLLLGSFAAEQQETRDAATFYTLSYNLAPTPMRGSWR